MALMSQLMEALVNVMTTLMNMLQTMMCRLNGVPGNSGNGAGVDNGGNTSGPVGSGNGGSVGNSNNSRNTGATDGTGGGTPGDVGGQAPLTNPGSSLGGIQSALDVNRNDAGMITVRTLDGYTVRAEGRDQAWSITGPDGRATRIWGDPHVSESDGDRWDFLNRSTFMFGKNKVTVEVVPAGNGQTLSARITIYSDKERVTIDGIEKNQPSIVAASSDGLQHDASLADGDIYKRVVTPTGESWVSATTGQVVPVSR